MAKDKKLTFRQTVLVYLVALILTLAIVAVLTALETPPGGNWFDAFVKTLRRVT